MNQIRNQKGQFIKGHPPVNVEKMKQKLKGHISWNKGTRGICKSNSGSFQKGTIPWNKGRKGIFKHSEETKIKVSKFNKGKIVSQNTKNKISKTLKGRKRPELTGQKHPLWKGGRKISKIGYVSFYQPNHPFANHDGYVYEHRIMMEKLLNRYLEPKEVVHHINGIRYDNRIENLRLFFNQSEHIKFHKV